jgi:hypothetical protein
VRETNHFFNFDLGFDLRIGKRIVAGKLQNLEIGVSLLSEIVCLFCFVRGVELPCPTHT